MADKTDIWVYADWKGMASPKCMGILSVHQAKGRKAFSFFYHAEWLKSMVLSLRMKAGVYPRLMMLTRPLI
jgi:hypothetical protein